MPSQRTPINAAIDEVERKAAEAEAAKLEAREAARIPVLIAPHRWTGEQEVLVEAMPGDHPTLLMWDGAQGAWRPVVLPPDSRWRIVPDRLALWTPGGPT